MKKRVHIIFLAVLFMIVITNLTGCDMFLNRKSIAEEALKNQYGEEFVAYHTWDHGGDSFRASMYPKDDEGIKFNTHVRNDASIITDYYAEKIVGKQIIEIIKPYIDEIADESAYFATVPIQQLGYTSKEQVSIQDFYTKGKNDESKWPFIYICINKQTMNSKATPREEYDTLMKIFQDVDLQALSGLKLVVLPLNGNNYDVIKQDLKLRTSMSSSFDQLRGSSDIIYVIKENDIININSNEYIQKRKEIDQNE